MRKGGMKGEEGKREGVRDDGGRNGGREIGREGRRVSWTEDGEISTQQHKLSH